MIIVWALRLNFYMFNRRMKTNRKRKDTRFDDVRESMSMIGAFWGFQAVSIFVL